MSIHTNSAARNEKAEHQEERGLLLAALTALVESVDAANFDLSKCVANTDELLRIADARKLALAAIAKAEGQ